ncbi:MAG: hypothetical protein A2493_01340 [Candidatus Magasanikbacteria bacterium RIFOXYC12_FULL_33_11]|uniref:PKD domain-containing protein n=1 Tax=Candidatus Magasanikbacteria bacterium RIFOXYC12_FULL_33_11 TaxID=1798701 RepID=A0A1F6NMA0_9BACT|nr:MAG: hypothetical protein A2493_01340 [Candidatus Magasanikbacteria bacterium RIFOXYC12_FULL_33_11]
MFKKIFLFLAVVFYSLFPFITSAQNVAGVVVEENYSAVIFSEDYVQVGKKIIFDSSKSILPNTVKNAVYYWRFGDGSYEYADEVVHDYKKVGNYKVNLDISYVNEKGQKEIFSSEKSVFVYDTRALMIVDEKSQSEIDMMKDQARNEGVALEVLSPAEDMGFFSEDILIKLISEHNQYVKNSDLILFYTKSLRGLQAFTQYFQSLNDVDKELIKNKMFITFTEGNIDVVTHGVYQNYQIIKPEYILLTRSEALSVILNAKDINEIETSLFGRGIELKKIDDESGKSKFFILSTLVNYFIEKGVPADSVYLILIISFLAFFIIFFRNVVGINTFGVFTPIIVTIAFYTLGLYLGLLTFFFAVIVSQIMKYAFEKIELLYLSKVALNLSFISISFLFLIAIILKFNLAFSLTGAIFPMLVMTTLSEKFMEAKSEIGLKTALFGVFETLFVVLLSYYFILWSSFNNLLISWPEIIIIPILAILILGKFTGLRISEYIRFRSLFVNHTGEEE